MTDNPTKLMEEAEGATPPPAQEEHPKHPTAKYIGLSTCDGRDGNCDCGRLYLEMCADAQGQHLLAEAGLPKPMVERLILEMARRGSFSASELQDMALVLFDLSGEVRTAEEKEQLETRH